MFEEDRHLALQLSQGDKLVFRAFFSRYAPLLVAFVSRRARLDHAEVEDVVQNAMLRALRGMSGYRGEASLLTWMCQICRSELADTRRRADRRPTVVSMDSDARASESAARAAAAVELQPEVIASAGEQGADVVRILERLPERYAQALEWKYGDELSVGEIARHLGVSVTAAQSLLARARDAFREAWQLERNTD